MGVQVLFVGFCLIHFGVLAILLSLSNLKLNKSRDNDGYLNEIFKDGVIGDNMKKSLLIMMNKIKLLHLFKRLRPTLLSSPKQSFKIVQY